MLRAIIPAAGKGTRSDLSFPKTLQLVDGKPILVRLLETLRPFDACPAVIVSPGGKTRIEETVRAHDLRAELLVQQAPLGMGHAVRQFENATEFGAAKELIVLWGDMLSLSQDVIRECLSRFRRDGADFGFPTACQDPCYTWVKRGEAGQVEGVLERRELGDAVPSRGEADCGLFIFRKGPLFTLLRCHDQALIGPVTGEINFLPAIGELAKRGYDVRAYQIARDADAFAFNSPDDLRAYASFRSRESADAGKPSERN